MNESLKASTPDPIEFGTDGWRAIIAEQFTFANVERLTQAIGRYVMETYPQAAKGELPVLIGYDTRFLADKFALRAAQVLAQMGIESKLSAHDLPTPTLAFAAQNEPTAGALQFTASHNPPEYCGIKYLTHFGGPATNDVTARIAAHIKDRSTFVAKEQEAPTTVDFKAPYVEAISKLVDLSRIGSAKLRVGYDALYSTSRGYVDGILEKHGVEVKVLHNWRDTTFGGGMPEPKKEYLKDLMSLVKTHQLDVGLATDGDADRFGVIDEKGDFLTPNQLLCLLTRHLVVNRGSRGAIVRTVGTTHMLDKLAKRYGLEVIETPVGFKYIGEQMRNRDVLIGGEDSGGVSIKGHIPEKDGILANLLVLEMMAVESKPISRIWQDLISEVGSNPVSHRSDLKLLPAAQNALFEAIDAKPFSELAGQTVISIGRLDGYKFYFKDDSWLLVRKSGTEPLVRLHAEAGTPEQADQLLEGFKLLVEKILTSLDNSANLSEPRDVAKAAH